MSAFNLMRLEAEFYTPPVLYVPTLLDGLLAWCLSRELRGQRSRYCGPAFRAEVDQLVFPRLGALLALVEGCAVASELQLDGPVAPARESRKKRFEAARRYSHWCDFGKGKPRKLNVSAAPYRAYNKPLPLHAARAGHFLFQGDAEYVLYLVQRHVQTLGKDGSAGYGWIERWRLVPTTATVLDILALRPVPVPLAERLGLPGGVREYRSWRVPYHDPRNQVECRCPERRSEEVADAAL